MNEQEEETSIRSMKSIGWLLDHHKTKESDRQKMIADLTLNPGDHILDLGCGPGLWTESFMKEVAPEGRVTGIDIDPDYIQYAKTYNHTSQYSDKITFEVGNFHEIPYPNHTFDMVFCGNFFQFVEEPEKLLEEIKRVTKKGGRISEKSFDGSALIFHPMDSVLIHRVLTATAHSLAENPVCPPFNCYFDNYIGRKNRGFFRKSGLADITTCAYAIQKYFPLSEPERRYIENNARWYLDIARDFLTEEDITAWTDCFDQNSDRYIMDSEDFYYCMVEIMSIGTHE